MALSFSLRNANLVAHLVNGNVQRYLDEAVYEPDVFEANIDFVSNFVHRDPAERDGANVFFTTQAFKRTIESELIWLRDKWPELLRYWAERQKEWRIDPYYQVEMIHFFSALGKILSRCKIKALLLPGFTDTEVNRALRSRDLIEQLVEIHPGSSALILQVTDLPKQKDTTVFDVFKKFDVAFEKIDQWPGVLIWDKRRSVFVPIARYAEIIDIFVNLRDNPVGFFRDIEHKSAISKKFVYLFHISDLHFGFSKTTNRIRRLKAILKDRLNRIDDCLAAIPVITGDIQNSPQLPSAESFGDFCDALHGYGFNDPIIVPGNHDERLMGISSTFSRRAETFGVSSRPIESFAEYNLQFLRFDSNLTGIGASGGIGEQQLIAMGGRLERPEFQGFFNIAVLHHHPIAINDPDWYRQDFYERILTPHGRVLTQRLNDADRFLEWLRLRKIGFVLHGHKHIPKVHSDNTGSIQVIAAGSSTGNVLHQDWRKTYLSYNILKFDPDVPKILSCTIVAEEVIGGGERDILIQTY